MKYALIGVDAQVMQAGVINKRKGVMLICVRYHTCWAWGSAGAEYKIIEWFKDKETKKEAIEAWLEDENSEHDWSDKYRGIKWSLLRKIPKKLIIKRVADSVKYAGYKIEYALELLEYLN